MRLALRLFILALWLSEAISHTHHVGPYTPGYVAATRAFGSCHLKSRNYTRGSHFSQCLNFRTNPSSQSPFILPLPVTASRGSSSTTVGTARLSTFLANIRIFRKRLETVAKLSVALCIAFRTAVGNRFRVDNIEFRRRIDGVVVLCIALPAAVANRFRVDGVELRRRIIDGVVVAFSVSIVSSIASYYIIIINKIQGQAVNSCTFVIDPDVMSKLLQDDGLRCDKSKGKVIRQSG